MSDLAEPALRLAVMRNAFDAAFAEPGVPLQRTQLDFVALRIGDQPYAICTSEIAGVHAGMAVTPVPSHIHAFVGIAAHSGEMLPVYDLGLVLGLSASHGSWAVVDTGNSVGLLFSAFDDHWRVDAGSVIAVDDGANQKHVQQLVQWGDVVRPVIAIASLLASIREQASRAKPKE